MIYVSIAHSYVNNYRSINSIDVNLEDELESIRINRILDKHNRFEGELLGIGTDFTDYLSKLLMVSKKLIDLDIVEIDCY